VKGNRIREGHANYPLMYNMLTGIRVTVSKQISKPDRDVNQSDFDAANKLAFEITGNETTPSSRYDFKFKDYAPWVFRKIRTHLRLESMDYLMSLTSRYILSEVGSPGKSGSLFYYSYDYRFIIKTIRESEHKLLLRILPDYYQHIKSHPDTLLSRIYGLHRIQMPEHSGKIYFVVMSNIFPPDRDIHEIFDLKGSTLGRKLDDELAKKPGSVMKDINWLEKRRKIELGPVKRDLFIQQLVLDVDLLARLNILDYSLLIGIHYLSRGNRELIRQGKLQVLAPDAKGLKRTHTLTGASRVAAMRRVLETVEPQSLSESTTAKLLPEDGGTLPPRLDLALSTMYQDDGGLMATDERDRPTDMIYYLGVIDILTPYNMKKRVESVFKAVIHGGGQGVSAVHPHKYARRFLQFIVNSIKHHDDV
ncbi:SAICAR synthase-like protein, partial [Ramicandelaber brevisporus]